MMSKQSGDMQGLSTKYVFMLIGWASDLLVTVLNVLFGLSRLCLREQHKQTLNTPHRTRTLLLICLKATQMRKSNILTDIQCSDWLWV
eukprot:scaffold72224_cov27-Prasinocladus_malaysianus.AAC.1